MTTRIGPEALRPNPALVPLTPLVGHWRTTRIHPLVLGTTFHGRTSFEWHKEGAFMLMRSEIDEPEIPGAVAVTFTMLYFDERALSRRYTVELADGEVRWHRDEAGFAQRMVFTIPADGTRLTREGRCRTTAALGKTTSGSPTNASTRRTHAIRPAQAGAFRQVETDCAEACPERRAGIAPEPEI